MKRIHVLISGVVQGVGFRAHALQEARSLALTGWVRNYPDGRVEALFEGEDASTEAMLAWCRRGPTLASVKDVEVREEPYTASMGDFQIRY